MICEQTSPQEIAGLLALAERDLKGSATCRVRFSERKFLQAGLSSRRIPFAEANPTGSVLILFAIGSFEFKLLEFVVEFFIRGGSSQDCAGQGEFYAWAVARFDGDVVEFNFAGLIVHGFDGCALALAGEDFIVAWA